MRKLTDEEFGQLTRSSLLRELDQCALREIASALSVEHWPARKIVMTPEATCKRFYLLLQGRITASRQNPETGRELTVFFLGPDDGFNVISLLDGNRHELTAETLDPVTAVSAPIKLWYDWLDRYPSLQHTLHCYIDKQLRQLSELATDLALHDTMARLSHLILRNYEASQENPRRDLLQGLSNQELAHLIGTVRVVVNRLLRELQKEGVIEYRVGELHVLDLQKLLCRAEQALVPTDSV